MLIFSCHFQQCGMSPSQDEQQKPNMGVNRLFIELDEQGFHVPSSVCMLCTAI